MNPGRVDIAAVRAAHPLTDVVAGAGVELRRTGHGFMGCCPFHDDSTASLSVDGVPDRFHCFGCGVSGDVIDFVQRLYRLPFPEAVAHLEGRMPLARPERSFPGGASAGTPARAQGPTLERAHAVNALAWAYYTRPVAHAAAISHLRRRRGLDVSALQQQLGQPVAGHTGHRWTALTDHLRAAGVGDADLLALDLAQPTRRGTLIDTLRDRLVVPVTTPDGHVAGFIGRDTSGERAAPKYRNPTRTVTYDKATTCYQPAPARHDHTAVIVVEGPLDALAVASAAAATGRLDAYTPVTTGGTSVTPAHARHVASLTCGPVVIAMDGDTAGRDGTRRWVAALHPLLNRTPLLAPLPPGRDPADWIAQHGTAGLALLDPDRLTIPARHGCPGPTLT